MVRDHLNDGGVMVVNLNMYSENEGSINEYLKDTIASVFPEVLTVDVPYATNRELFASMQPGFAGRLRDGAAAYAEKNAGAAGIRAELADLMMETADQLELCEGGDLILTDDKAPVEMLGMKEIDNIIKDELVYYREMIKNGDFTLF